MRFRTYPKNWEITFFDVKSCAFYIKKSEPPDF
jgi:hypothetical protein